MKSVEEIIGDFSITKYRNMMNINVIHFFSLAIYGGVIIFQWIKQKLLSKTPRLQKQTPLKNSKPHGNVWFLFFEAVYTIKNQIY